MFKGFSDSSRNKEFHGFPNLNFQMNNEAYGFSGCNFWFDADYGLNTKTNLAAVSSWTDRIKNQRFVQATAGNQPRYIESNVLYNNYPTIEGVDANRFLNSAIKITALTYIIIANYNIISNTSSVLGTNTGSTPNVWIGLGGTLSGINGVHFYNFTNSLLRTGSTENTSVKIAVLSRFGIMVNGVTEFVGNSLIENYGFNRILSTDGGTNNGVNGNVAEIIGFNNEFTESEALSISTNINQKYAIY
jgi:hypothetical protein